jgi:hypothetical protein
MTLPEIFPRPLSDTRDRARNGAWTGTVEWKHCSNGVEWIGTYDPHVRTLFVTRRLGKLKKTQLVRLTLHEKAPAKVIIEKCSEWFQSAFGGVE